MIVLLNILILAGLAIAGYRFSHKSGIIDFYWPGLALKVIAGIGLGLLYSYYYTDGDTWVMFNEAIKLAGGAFTSAGRFLDIYILSDYSVIPDYIYIMQPRAAFMTKILALLALITNHNYWLSACYLSMFSFFGFWLAANTVYKIFGSKITAVLPTLFFPSIVFWSSGVIKESIAIGSLAGVLAILVNAYYKKSVAWLNMLLLIIGMLLLLYLKYYYAALLIVTFATIFTTRAILPKTSKTYVEIGSILMVFTAILGIASLSHPNFWPSRFLFVMVDNYYQFLEKSSTENVVMFNDLSPTFASFLFYGPKALFGGLFYPLWMKSFNIVKLASVIENWLILISFIFALRWFKLPKLKNDRLLLLGMMLFIVISAIFITFSTPNLGTLARFKIGYLLVFVTMVTGVITNRLKAV
jgi:hypothetical protein